MPLVSIIMPLYNSEKYVSEAIESVLAQTSGDWELIICDDCSSDNSVSIVEEYVKKDSRIRLLKNEKNSGTAATRNHCLSMATGKYVTLLDSDDVWFPTFLEKQTNFIKEKGSAAVTASYNIMSSNGKKPFIVPDTMTHKSIMKKNTMSCLTTMYDREKSCGLRFDESLRKREDLAFWCDLLKKNGPCYGNKEILADYRIVATSKSRKKTRLIKYQWAVYRKSQHLNVFTSFYYLCCWALNGIVKYKNVK